MGMGAEAQFLGVETELELQYLSIPVLARLQFETPVGIGVFVNGRGLC